MDAYSISVYISKLLSHMPFSKDDKIRMQHLKTLLIDLKLIKKIYIVKKYCTKLYSGNYKK